MLIGSKPGYGSPASFWEYLLLMGRVSVSLTLSTEDPPVTV